MKRILIIAILAVLALGATATSSTKPPTVQQLRAKVQSQARMITRLQNQIGDLQNERDAQDDVLNAQGDKIAEQADTITKLRARDPMDAVLARDPDGLWSAMIAIYGAFPTLPAGVFCGYAKAQDTLGQIGLVATTYTFYRWTGC